MDPVIPSPAAPQAGGPLAAEPVRGAPEAFAAAAALWIFAALLWPEEKLSLGLLGGSPGSSTTGANPFYSEVGAFALAAWALAVPALRARIPAVLRWAALCWSAAVLAAGLRGLAGGNHYRDVLAEGRIVALAPALLALGALDGRGRRLAWSALAWGALAWCAWQAALVWAEPTGLCNMAIVPVAIAASEHGAHLQWMSLLAAVVAGGLWLDGWGGLALCAGAWTLLWLSLVRGLWIAGPLGALTAALALALGGGLAASRRYLAFQAAGLLLGLLCAFGVYRAASPDGIFLLQFRLQRLAQGVHLAPAPAEHPELGSLNSGLFREIVRRGGLYRNLIEHEEAALPGRPDPSLVERDVMRRQALAAFKASPLLGSGLGLVLHIPTAQGEKLLRDPHNGPSWFLADMGLVGALCALAGLAALAQGLWARRRRAGWVTAAAAAALLMALSLELVQPGILHASMWLPLAVLGTVLREPGTA